MALYKIDNNQIVEITKSTFAQENLKERKDLQNMLKRQIGAICPNTLIIAEEFGEWEDSRRRIDLLGIDKEANLVVIELKRTEDGGHMELQALRYAAMISTLTFAKLLPIYEQYLKDEGSVIDPKESLLDFLDWTEVDEDNFAQKVRIVLASANFSKELTTSVMWLNEYGLDIECVRMHPYKNNGETFIDIQKVIPIPEAEDYQVRIREKKQKERESREHNRDFTKFDVTINGKIYPAQSKRWMMFHIISEIVKSGISPQVFENLLPSKKFKIFGGLLNEQEVYDKIMSQDKGGTVPRSDRYFVNKGEFFYAGDKTYVLSNQWGNGTLEAIEKLIKAFPKLNIEIKESQ